MIGLLLLAVVAGGMALYGRTFLQNLWTNVGDAARKAVASRIFVYLISAIVAAFVIPLLGALIGMWVSKAHHFGPIAAGPGLGRAILYGGLMIGVMLLATVWAMAQFFAEVLHFLYPWRIFDKLRRGIKQVAIAGLMWLLFIGGWLWILGVTASVQALGAALLGALLYWVVSEYFHMPLTYLKPIAISMAVGLMLWGAGAAIPGSFWLGVGLPNFRPILNFWEALDDITLDAEGMARGKRIQNHCRIQLELARGKYVSTGFDKVARLDKVVKDMERACAKGDAGAIDRLAKELSNL